MLYYTHDYHQESKIDVIKTGVYTIEFLNKPGIYYVGSATKHGNKGRNNNGFHGRWREHLHMLFNNKHYNLRLQHNFNKYGKENLRFKIIDFYEPILCTGAEQYWLNVLDSYQNGYNLTCVVEKPSTGRKMCNEQKELYRQRMLGSNNPNYGKIMTKEQRQYLSECLSGENHPLFGRKLSVEQKKHLAQCNFKEILQYDKTGEFIKKWCSSEQIALELGHNQCNITKACRKNDMLSYKGHYWFYHGVYDDSEIKIIIQELNFRKNDAQRNKKRNPVNKKKVTQYDQFGNLIKTWDSCAEAERILNLSKGNISKVCSGVAKSYKGFIWKYI